MQLAYCPSCRWIYATGHTLGSASYQHEKDAAGNTVHHTSVAILTLEDIAWHSADATLAANAPRMKSELDARVPP